MRLSEDLRKWRAERPDKYTMDRFIRESTRLESKVEKFTSTNKRMAKLLEDAAELLRNTDDGKIAEAWGMINGVSAQLRFGYY